MTRWMKLPVVVAVVATVVGLAATGSAGGAGTVSAPAAAISASTTTPTGSSVLIAMGHLQDPSNTFWEVFLKPAGTASWVLHTPPGVASNGGLVLAASPSGLLTLGFLVSAALKFSPVAQSTDGGAKWSPGELPSALTSTPDALAVGPTGQALALVATGDQRVLQTSGDLSTWRTLTTTNALAPAASSCGVREATAVAYSPSGHLLLGLGCAHGGEVGILTPSVPSPAGLSAWHDIGFALGSGSGDASVTRLVSTAAGVAGLAQVRFGPRTSVVGFWGNGSNAQWVASARLAIPAGWAVKATATGGGSGQGLAVLLGSGDRRRVEVVTGPGTPWVTLPQTPRGASGVSGAGAEIDTFVVRGSHLAVWAWSEGATGWRRTASITVPVPYGSSS
jgi:hypothetical protein